MNAPFDAVIAVITDYFEGLYHSDTQIFRRVFHPSALYACATEGTLLRLDMGEYFPIVDKRPSPASRNEARADRIVSLEFAGPVTALARVQCTIAPKHFTVFMSKPERRGKVFIDYHRNDRGSTCVAPYSTRARPGAFVSAPIAWEELGGLQPRFHIFHAIERLKDNIDPWRAFFETQQRLTPEAVNWLRA